MLTAYRHKHAVVPSHEVYYDFLAKRLGIAFSSTHIFSDSLKVFGLLVILLNIFCKKVMFSKFSDF